MENINSLINSRGHKREDEESLRFYQMPKILFKSEEYRKLSLGARAMYSVLRDRQELSIKNNWTDENGFYFLIYTIENLADELSISERTVSTYKKELAKAELLAEKRQGQGKPNRIYILKPNYDVEDTFINKEYESYPQGQPIGNTKTRNICKSRLEKIASQDSKKLQTNDTDVNETDVSDTHSFIQEEKKERKNLDNTQDKINQRKAEDILKKSNYTSVDELYHSSIEYAIYEFLCNDNLHIKGQKVYKGLIEKQLEKLTIEHIDNAIRKFEEAKKHTRIKNDHMYFMSCLYESLFSTDIELKGDLVEIGQ